MKEELRSLTEKIGSNAEAVGWIDTLRIHSKVAFIDLRDGSGALQVVVEGALMEELKGLGHEYLVSIHGDVVERGEKQRTEAPLGDIELKAQKIEVITPSETPPFPINEDTRAVHEELRFEHRYLDLRSERMQRNIKKRHEAILHLRNFLAAEGFLEIETPQLTKGTPEGAREFIVPSRREKGKGYVLPQSPQQYKQLLMVGGFSKYFQMARCFRDEDKRKDRQPEFTQLDLEMAFVEQEDVLSLIEHAVIDLLKKVFPQQTIQTLPFPRISYNDAMKQYGSDKPDLRGKDPDPNTMAFCWVVDFPMFEKDEKTDALTAAHHPFTKPQDAHLEGKSEEELLSIPAFSYDLVLNGYELGSGSIRIHSQNLQRDVFEVLGLPQEEIDGRFGHLLKAFQFAPPPHGGFAIGLDRTLAVLLGEENIREVIPFPKTGEGKELTTGAPADIPDVTFNELGIRLAKEEKSHDA